MKRSEVIRLLNQDLSGEIEAILVYMRNSFVTGQCRPSRGMEEIAKDEMRHAEWLAELIVDLGGVPTMQHRPLNFGRGGTEGYLKRLIALEEEAIAMYSEHIRLIKDERVASRLKRILEEEIEHRDEFSELLGEVKKGG